MIPISSRKTRHEIWVISKRSFPKLLDVIVESNFETLKPKDQKTSEPRNQVTSEPGTQETEKPRNQETKNQETKKLLHFQVRELSYSSTNRLPLLLQPPWLYILHIELSSCSVQLQVFCLLGFLGDQAIQLSVYRSYLRY